MRHEMPQEYNRALGGGMEFGKRVCACVWEWRERGRDHYAVVESVRRFMPTSFVRRDELLIRKTERASR